MPDAFQSTLTWTALIPSSTTLARTQVSEAYTSKHTHTHIHKLDLREGKQGCAVEKVLLGHESYQKTLLIPEQPVSPLLRLFLFSSITPTAGDASIFFFGLPSHLGSTCQLSYSLHFEALPFSLKKSIFNSIFQFNFFAEFYTFWVHFRPASHHLF